MSGKQISMARSIETLTGHAQSDRLYGNAGADILNGTAGGDYLDGGDGNDRIDDASTGAEASIKLEEGSLLLDMGHGDAIHIENWDQVHPLETQSFSSFQFADGTSLSWSELLGRGFDLDGTEGDDVIVKDSWMLFDSRESRRWRDGERSLRAGNETAWRAVA